MCKECGCGEEAALVCLTCGGRVVLIDGIPVCTACGARGSAEGVAPPAEERPHHEPSHRDQPSKGRPDDLTRLRILLPHWLEHNDEHLHDLRAWAATARTLGQGAASDLMEQAIKHMEAGNRDLAAALEALAH